MLSYGIWGRFTVTEGEEVISTQTVALMPHPQYKNTISETPFCDLTKVCSIGNTPSSVSYVDTTTFTKLDHKLTASESYFTEEHVGDYFYFGDTVHLKIVRFINDTTVLTDLPEITFTEISGVVIHFPHRLIQNLSVRSTCDLATQYVVKKSNVLYVLITRAFQYTFEEDTTISEIGCSNTTEYLYAYRWLNTPITVTPTQLLKIEIILDRRMDVAMITSDPFLKSAPSWDVSCTTTNSYGFYNVDEFGNRINSGKVLPFFEPCCEEMHVSFLDASNFALRTYNTPLSYNTETSTRTCNLHTKRTDYIFNNRQISFASTDGEAVYYLNYGVDTPKQYGYARNVFFNIEYTTVYPTLGVLFLGEEEIYIDVSQPVASDGTNSKLWISPGGYVRYGNLGTPLTNITFSCKASKLGAKVNVIGLFSTYGGYSVNDGWYLRFESNTIYLIDSGEVGIIQVPLGTAIRELELSVFYEFATKHYVFTVNGEIIADGVYASSLDAFNFSNVSIGLSLYGESSSSLLLDWYKLDYDNTTVLEVHGEDNINFDTRNQIVARVGPTVTTPSTCCFIRTEKVYTADFSDESWTTLANTSIVDGTLVSNKSGQIAYTIPNLPSLKLPYFIYFRYKATSGANLRINTLNTTTGGEIQGVTSIALTNTLEVYGNIINSNGIYLGIEADTAVFTGTIYDLEVESMTTFPYGTTPFTFYNGTGKGTYIDLGILTLSDYTQEFLLARHPNGTSFKEWGNIVWNEFVSGQHYSGHLLQSGVGTSVLYGLAGPPVSEFHTSSQITEKVVLRRAGGTLYLYVNGIFVHAISSTAYSEKHWYIGTNPSAPYNNYAFLGCISNMAIYNYAKTAEQIAAETNILPDGITGNPIRYYPGTYENNTFIETVSGSNGTIVW